MPGKFFRCIHDPGAALLRAITISACIFSVRGHARIRICQQAELCQIRRDDIRPFCQALHLLLESGREQLKPCPIIPHDRIHEKKGIFPVKCLQKSQGFPDLAHP